MKTPHILFEGEFHTSPPESMGSDGISLAGPPKVFKQYLVLRALKGHLRDKDSGVEVTEVVLPWCTSTVAQGCAVS